ncbi:MAG TPA: DUF87 domain-containing protein [Clostridia bacterium]|nr:DUF87 domain-containing protein [Clostridia bacterium]
MKIVIGKSADGRQVGFDLDTLITTRLLIQANSGAGKSYLSRRFMEQLFGHIQVIAIDPEGEFATLREQYGYVLVGKGGETPADVRSAATVAEKLLELRASAVCDLYEMKPSERHRWVQAFLEAIVNAPKALWHPVIILIDEAHVFCPEKGAGESVASEAVIDLVTRGRKRGFCPVLATQRLSKLRKDASAELLNRLVGGTFEDVDIKRAVDLLSIAPEDRRDFVASLRTLDPGWFYALGRAVSKERVLFKVDPVATSHPKPGSAKHAAEPPPTPDQVKALLPKLGDLPKAAEEKARTVDDLKAKIRSLTAEVAAAKRERPAAPAAAVDPERLKATIEKSVRTALKERDLHWTRSLRDYQRSINGAIAEVGTTLAEAVRSVAVQTPEPIGEISADVQVVAKPPLTVKDRIIEDPPRRIHPDQANAESNGDITRPQYKILSALAQFEAIGRTSVPKKWVAALAQVSHTSSAYGNNLGALRTGGYIEYPAPGEVALTAEGRRNAPQVDPPRSPEEMFDRCAQIVTRPQAAILDVLRQKYPHAMDKQAVADLAGASATSSAYGNNLGALRSAGMIDYPAPGKIRAADWLFLEES